VFSRLLVCLCSQQTKTYDQCYQSSACLAFVLQVVTDMECQDKDLQVCTRHVVPSPCGPFFSGGARRGRSVPGAPGGCPPRAAAAPPSAAALCLLLGYASHSFIMIRVRVPGFASGTKCGFACTTGSLRCNLSMRGRPERVKGLNAALETSRVSPGLCGQRDCGLQHVMLCPKLTGGRALILYPMVSGF